MHVAIPIGYFVIRADCKTFKEMLCHSSIGYGHVLYTKLLVIVKAAKELASQWCSHYLDAFSSKDKK